MSQKYIEFMREVVASVVGYIVAVPVIIGLITWYAYKRLRCFLNE